MKKGLLLLLIIIPVLAISQVNKYGFPFYRYYSMEEYGGTEQNWAVVKDNRGILYVGNNDKGVLQYDGTNWRSVPISNNSIVRSLGIDDNGVVYVGAVGDFGRLLPDKNGFLVYSSLVDKLDSTQQVNFPDVWKTYATDSIVYFCTYRYIFKYYKNQDIVKTIDLPKSSFFTYLIDDEIFISHYRRGILKHIGENGDTLFQNIGKDLFKKKSIFVLEKLNDSTILVGTSGNGLFKLKVPGYSTKVADCKQTSEFLKNNILYHSNISEDFSAFATLAGGVLVTKQMQPFEIYGDKSGLPKDQTVIYLYSDEGINTPLWAGLNNGLIRFDWHLPFRLMDERSGLSGHVSAIMRYNGKLYIGSSSGLFILKYDEKYPYFERVGDLDASVYSLVRFTYPETNNEVLLVGTIKGIFEINKYQKISQIERRIRIDENSVYTNDKDFYIYSMGALNKENPNEVILGTKRGMWIFEAYENYWKEIKTVDLNSEVRSISYNEDGYWFGTSFKGVIRYDPKNDSVYFFNEEHGLVSKDLNFVSNVNGETVLLSSGGIFKYSKSTNSFVKYQSLNQIAEETGMGVSKFVRDHNFYYMNMYNKNRQKIRRINIDGNFSEYDTAIFNRLPNVQFDVIYPEDDVVWLGSSKGLYAYIKSANKVIPGKKFHTLIRAVSLKNDSVLTGGSYLENGKIVSKQLDNSNIKLSFGENDIEFRFSAPFFEKEDELLYSYKLEGYNNEWSPWSSKTEEDYNNLPAGDYVFKVKAKNIYGFESGGDTNDSNLFVENAFAFRIMPPWYATIYAIIGYFILLVLLVRFIVQWRTRKLKLEKERLERIVEERTAEIMEKKDEIEKQRDEIAEKNQSITDSIHYASRIQQALLPSTQMFEESVPEHFVLFKPRDIVSGDYYWMTRIEQKVILVAADCTGHGVPGAFMSMLGMSFLNEIVNKNITTDAGEILNQLRAHVIDALKQEGDDVKAKDGMDLALYVIDRENNTINFAGANNPLYIIRELTEEEKQAIKDGDESKLPKRPVYDETHILQEIKADKMPIGIHIKNQPFETKVVPIQKGMQLYTFSDGYVDQFGGPKRRKFMSKAFKQLLIQIYMKPMQEQRQILDETIIKWIEDGNEIQVDDIIVLGVRIIK
jgi:serine phosphatase RsbU (regulator of sigma subunit)/ligand-binding sensor domain-containing protein